MLLKNYMEDIVIEKLDEILKQYPDCCTCEQCKNDIAILALNNLPTKYLATSKDEVFAHLERTKIETTVKVVEEIIKAIEIVSKNPNHN